MGNVSGLRLQQEHQIPVFLCLVVVRESPLLHLRGVFKVACDFVLLAGPLVLRQRDRGKRAATYLFEGHAVLDQERNARVEVANVLLENEVLLGLRRDLGLEVPQNLLSCSQRQHLSRPPPIYPLERTFGEVVFDNQVGFIGRHGHVQSGHGVPL